MNKKILPALVLVALCLVVLFSCSKTITSSSIDPTTQYFPTKLGKYVVYNVDSTIYVDSTCKIKTNSSQVRYSFSDTFRDDQKRLSYLVDVQARPDANSIWTAQGTIYVTPTQTQIEYTQKNLDFIKLTFPVSEGNTWNGTGLVSVNDSAYMFMGSWVYKYQNVGQSYNNGFTNFSNTATVLENDSTIANTASNSGTVPYYYRNFFKEVYAYNVGLIYREMTHITYDSIKAPCMNGYSVTMRAVDYN